MTKLQDQLSEQRVFNPYDFYHSADPFKAQPHLFRRVSHSYRDVYPSGWYVSKGKEDLTDGKGHFLDNGKKFFSYHSKEGAHEALTEALKWATERFGIEDWIRDPWGGYGSASFIRRRLAELKERSAPLKLEWHRTDQGIKAEWSTGYAVIYKSRTLGRPTYRLVLCELDATPIGSYDEPSQKAARELAQDFADRYLLPGQKSPSEKHLES